MATTESYVLKDGQLVPEEQETAPITTRTNVSQIPKLDIQFKPIVTDNIGNNVQPQANADIDWNQNQNIINVGGFRGFRKRKALRDALNANKNNIIWNGNGFQRVNTGLGADRWSRRDVRRLMRSYNDNWFTFNNQVPLEGNNANYAAYLSENYLANNPTATNFRWIAGKYPQKAVEEQPINIQSTQSNTVADPYYGFRNADWLTVDYSHRKNNLQPSESYLQNYNNINKVKIKKEENINNNSQQNQPNEDLMQEQQNKQNNNNDNIIVNQPLSDIRPYMLSLKYPQATPIAGPASYYPQQSQNIENANNSEKQEEQSAYWKRYEWSIKDDPVAQFLDKIFVRPFRNPVNINDVINNYKY